MLLKHQQPRNSRRWNKALPEASPSICAESVTTPWLINHHAWCYLQKPCVPKGIQSSTLLAPEAPCFSSASHLYGQQCLPRASSPSHDPLLFCQLLVSTPKHRISLNMPTLAIKDTLELTLSIQTPEAHGARHESMDVVGKSIGCSTAGPKLTGRSQHCVAPSRQKHTTPHSSLPGDTLAHITDSATPPQPLTRECPAIAACLDRQLPEHL